MMKKVISMVSMNLLIRYSLIMKNKHRQHLTQVIKVNMTIGRKRKVNILSLLRRYIDRDTSLLCGVLTRMSDMN